MSAGHLRFVALPQNLKAAARCPYDERGGEPPRAPLRRFAPKVLDQRHDRRHGRPDRPSLTRPIQKPPLLVYKWPRVMALLA